MEFLHKRSLLLLRISLGVTFLWFGVLKLFNVSPVLEIIRASFPNGIGESQLFIFLIAFIEILIGATYLSNRYVKLASIVMIISLIIVSTASCLSSCFDPRFPILSLIGESLIKNLVLMAAGLVLISDPSVGSGQEKSEPPVIIKKTS